MNQIKVICLIYLLLSTSASIAQNKTDLEVFEKGNLKTSPNNLEDTNDINFEFCLGEVIELDEIHLNFAAINEQGNPIEKFYYNNDSGFYFQHKFKYDDHGYLVEESSYNSKGNSYCQYKYDKQGKLIEEFFYYSDGSSAQYKYRYEYDDKGNLQETISVTIVE